MLAPDLPWRGELTIAGTRARLLHVGFVVDDLQAAMTSFALRGQAARTDWTDPAPRPFILSLPGRTVLRQLRIVHSVEPLPRCELIERCDDSPWETATGATPHHVCYASVDSLPICLELEQSCQRLLGRPGEGAGYFRMADGRLIEIVSLDAARRLYADLPEFASLS